METLVVLQKDEVEVRRLIEELDLGPIKVKLMDPEEGQGWSREEVNLVEVAYKRFLFLTFKCPDKAIVPSKIVDEFWHKHILDTRKYAEDCERIFGFFLHHFPYFGMRGEEDAENLQISFAETLELYKSEFGESLSELRVVDASKCDSCGTGSCGHGYPWCSKCSGGGSGGDQVATAHRINSQVRPSFPGESLPAMG